MLIILLLTFYIVYLYLFSISNNNKSKDTRNISIYKNGKLYLKSLTEQEKEILRLYIDNKTKTQKFKTDNGVVMGLIKNNIIYKSSQSATGYMEFPYNIEDWIWIYLNKNKNLLK